MCKCGRPVIRKLGQPGGDIKQYEFSNLLHFNDYESGWNFAITGTIVVQELQ
jgi:hypothetical protein